jgi:hypothetical protein
MKCTHVLCVSFTLIALECLEAGKVRARKLDPQGRTALLRTATTEELALIWGFVAVAT